MKFLKWTESVKQTVSKEDILNKVEKAEIIHHIVTGSFFIVLLIGDFFVIVAPNRSNLVGLGLAVMILGSTGYLASTIRGYLKLERYKAIWDKLELQQSELRQMQAKDL